MARFVLPHPIHLSILASGNFAYVGERATGTAAGTAAGAGRADPMDGYGAGLCDAASVPRQRLARDLPGPLRGRRRPTGRVRPRAAGPPDAIVGTRRDLNPGRFS